MYNIPEKYTANLMSSQAKVFLQPENLKKDFYQTGISALDAILGGGFTAGIHCLGAVPSLGKSTFAYQIAEKISENHKHPVIIFSLEMRSEDIISKSISRQSFILNHSSYYTSMDLFSGNIEITDDYKTAQANAASLGNNILIYDGRSDFNSAEKIIHLVREFMEFSQTKPFIIIDYLQLLRGDLNKSEKQMADSNLATFRKLADTGDIPILLISSFNRDSYHSPVSLKSYKESGGIEYSADTLIGIQLRNIGCKGFDINKAMRQPVRDLELVILKQRYGELGDLPIFFNPSANIFSDSYDDVSPASSENVYWLYLF